MNRDALFGLGAKYTVLYAGITVLLVFFGSRVFDYAFGLAALLMLLGTLVVVPVLFGTSDAGLDTVEAGGVSGFQNITDPSRYQPGRLALPGKLQFGFYFIGIAAYSVIGLVVVV